MGCPALAEFYIAVDSRQTLLQALAYGHQRHLDITLLGGGSNVVCLPKIPGLVIQLKNLGKTLLNVSAADTGPENTELVADRVTVSVQAGENWHDFVCWTLQQGLRGLENLSLIPGSVGAAPIQNIGAYGVEVESCLESVKAIHKISLEEKVFHHQDCQFGYRDSIFKHQAQHWIIWEVTFCLSALAPLHTKYAELRNEWEAAGCPDDARQLSALVCKIRQRKLPDPREIPNAGSFFKNPVISLAQWQHLTSKFSDLVSYPQADGTYKLAAGWLIQRAGWKGFADKGVGVCDTQALVIINPHHRSGREVVSVAHKIQNSVADLFGVRLEIEPVIL